MTPPNLAQLQLRYQQQEPYYRGSEPPYGYSGPAQYGYGSNLAGNEHMSVPPPHREDQSRGRTHHSSRSSHQRHEAYADPHYPPKQVIVLSDASSDDDRSSIEYEVRKVRRPHSHRRATSYSPDYQSTRSHHKSSSKRATSHDRYDHVRGHSRHRRPKYHSGSHSRKSPKPADHPDRYEKDSFHREKVPFAEMEEELGKFKKGPATHQDYQDVVNLWNSGSHESAWRLIQSIQKHPDARHKKLGAKGSKKHRHRSP